MARRTPDSPPPGHKASLYEGGIRTPFLVSWPARFPGGRTIDTPVLFFDLLPTALDAIGAAPPAGTVFDGRSLLPLLTGATTRHHDRLHWSSGGLNGEWAVREGDWKLHALRDQRELINLAEDPAEARNLAAEHPEKVRALTALHEAWLEPMAEPITGGSKRWGAAGGGDSQRAKDRAAKKASRKQERTPGKQPSPAAPPP